MRFDTSGSGESKGKARLRRQSAASRVHEPLPSVAALLPHSAFCALTNQPVLLIHASEEEVLRKVSLPLNHVRHCRRISPRMTARHGDRPPSGQECHACHRASTSASIAGCGQQFIGPYACCLPPNERDMRFNMAAAEAQNHGDLGSSPIRLPNFDHRNRTEDVRA